MNEQDYQVKGSTILSKFDFVEEQLGRDAIDRLRGSFFDKGAFPIIHSNWYAFDLYVEVLEAIAELGFGGDLARLVDVGVYSADTAFQEMSQSFSKAGGFQEFLQDIARLHRLLYNQGDIEVSLSEDGHGCEIWHRGKPRYADADLHVAAGFYRRVAELHNLASVACSFVSADDGARFSLVWAS